MNPKLKARIDSLLGEFDKLADKRREEYEQSIKALDIEGSIKEGIGKKARKNNRKMWSNFPSS